MARTLVIVESPAKSKTIEKFLGKDYKVLASYGHVRALPSKQGSVDVDAGFIPNYQIMPESQKHIDLLKKEVDQCEELLLATDLDREGEAIAWHLLEALGVAEKGEKPVVKRVTFHEITKPAILEAVANPHKISHELVDAQQARVILDYLVGFTLSPFYGKRSAMVSQQVAFNRWRYALFVNVKKRSALLIRVNMGALRVSLLIALARDLKPNCKR